MATASYEQPFVSVIITSFNRAGTIGRTVSSILNQTHRNIDIIVVDDGSTDNTLQVLKEFNDDRIRVIKHDCNRGATAAKNTGLDNVKGEWFTFVDSDDEIVPAALETLLRAPEEIDKSIDQVECNAMYFATGELAGHGLDHDQYLDYETFATRMKGDHWGIIKTALLQGDRFNETLPGYEDTLWAKIRSRSRAYYIQKGLEICHTEGGNRLSTTVFNTARTAEIYRNLLGENEWLDLRRRFRPQEFRGLCFDALLHTLAVNDRQSAGMYFSMLQQLPGNSVWKVVSSVVKRTGSLPALILLKGIPFIKNVQRRLRGK